MSISSIVKTCERVGVCAVALVCVVTALVTQPASALSAAQQNLYDNNIFNYDIDGAQSCGGTVGTVIADANQDKIAQTIIGIAKTDNVGQKGALIGLMVGLAESSLRILANSNVPISKTNPAKQGIGHDHDSVGVFQQRPSTDWSTFATGPAADSNKAAVFQLMEPAYSAEAFFGSPAGSKPPSALSHGLQNVSNWQGISPWVAAQRVQGSTSGDGSNYRDQMDKANGLLAKFWNSSPAIPLPVPLSGGSASGTDNGVGCSSSDVGLTGGSGKFTDSTTLTLTDSAKMVARAKKLADLTSSLFKGTCGTHPADCSHLCDYLSGVAWGYKNSGYNTALEHWGAMKSSGHAHPGDRNPPVGALLFYSTGNPAGHIATYLGGNLILSNDVGDPKSGHLGGAYIVPASAMEAGPWRLKYLGWSDDIFNGGRLTGSLAF